MGGFSEITYTVPAGQRRDMEKDSTAPGKHHPNNVMLPTQPRNRERATRGEDFSIDCLDEIS